VVDVFCKPKERRLQEFYKEQMKTGLSSREQITETTEDEVASDLTTKSSQNHERSQCPIGCRNSPSEYQRVRGSPLTSQEQLKPLALPKESNCDDRLSYKENVKGEVSTKLTENGDTETSSEVIISERSDLVSVDDANLQLGVTERSDLRRGHEGQVYVQEDSDVKILGDTRTIFTKNDSNNNNNNNNGEFNSLNTCNTLNVRYKNGVFWDVKPCGFCKNRRFGGT
jgi:hypothetical protein